MQAPGTTRTDAPSPSRALEDPLAGVRERVAALHDRMWRVLDDADHRSRRMCEAAGGTGAVVVRRTRPSGWLTVAGLGVLGYALVVQLLALARMAGDGHLDLLAGRMPTFVGLALLCADVVYRLFGEPLVAVGRAGVALGFPHVVVARTGRVRVVSVAPGRRPGVGIDVDLVPWRDVAAVVQVRGTQLAQPDVAEVGVRLRRPLAEPWPHLTSDGVTAAVAADLGLGTLLLTRPVLALRGRRLADLTAAVSVHSAGTPVEDVTVREARDLAYGWRRG